VGVKVSSKGHRDVTLYFDKGSGLLVKTERRALDPKSKQEVPEERVISDYRDLDGLQSPRKAVVTMDGKKVMEAEATEVKFLDKLDDSVFARP
jgi:hypothetical protein